VNEHFDAIPFHRLAATSKMVWLVVGDARTQLGRLEAPGLGEPILLDRDGWVVEVPAR
jgi:hypothetical protein